MKDASSVSRLSAVAALLLATLCFAGCDRTASTGQHGAGQHETAQDKERKYRSFLDQVIEITENQDKYPDSTFLRGAIERLNPWLAERPESVDYEPDEEFASLAEAFSKLATDLRRTNELIQLFVDETKKPEEKDGDELQALVESIQKQTDELGTKTASNTLKLYALYFDNLREQLASAKEFQFADVTETLQTRIRQFANNPAAQVFNFDSLIAGVEDFQRLLVTDRKSFVPQDADFLREAIWFRDVFSWAKGEKQDDLTIVKSLFDWSVRNVVTTPPMLGPAGPMSHTPWQTLLLSQGTALDRAIVFIELLRQHRLDAFVLRPEGEQRGDFPIVVGVRLNGETYLFLPEYALPIPGEGESALVLEDGLQFNSIATLTQVANNDSLLRRFDLEGKPFPASSKDFEKTVAYVPSTPFTVSARMIAMEREFSGKVNTVLSTPFESQKVRIAELDNIVGVQRLYEATAPVLEQAIFPYESENLIQIYMIASPGSKANLDVSDSTSTTDESIEDYTNSDSSSPTGNMTSTKKTQTASLWVAKNLYLRGRFIDENGASLHFLQGRVSDRLLKQEEASIPQRVREYVTQYQAWLASQTKEATEEELNSIAQEAAISFQMEVTTKRYIKILTSFYLALLSEAAGNDSAALDRLNDDSLRIRPQANAAQRSIGDEWRYAANYLRARILEKQGNVEVAINRFRLDAENVGNLVRAQWLEQLAGIPAQKETQSEPAQESGVEPIVEPGPSETLSEEPEPTETSSEVPEPAETLSEESEPTETSSEVPGPAETLSEESEPTETSSEAPGPTETPSEELQETNVENA